MLKRISGLSSKWSGRRAVAAVEFAVVSPLLLVLLTGVLEVGRLVEVKQNMSVAAAYAARQASTARPGYTTTYIQNIVKQNLTNNGLNATNAIVTFSNLDKPGTEPFDADQLNRLEITVTVPVNDVLLIQPEPGKGFWWSSATISVKVHILSMADIPIVVDPTLPTPF